jgi:hypothetical protein
LVQIGVGRSMAQLAAHRNDLAFVVEGMGQCPAVSDARLMQQEISRQTRAYLSWTSPPTHRAQTTTKVLQPF